VLDAIGLVVFTMAGLPHRLQMNESLPIVIVSGHDHGMRRRRVARYPLQRRALLFRAELYASVSS